MPDWKDTLNLPRTDFPMKANLPPPSRRRSRAGTQMDLYARIRASARRARRSSCCTTAPPTPAGNIHLGTALNKILKDIVVKSRTMAGYDAPYVVGYDCHGLPIELKVDKELGSKKRDMTVAEFCRACRAYAERFIGTMTEQFQRLGILGTWDKPYLTMDYRYQAAIARTFGRFVEKGLVYKGKKPVHWCIHCRTALAEAEVEYEPHTSPSIYVEFPLAPGKRGRAVGASAGACRPRRVGPDLDDDTLDDSVEPCSRVSPRVRLRRVRDRRPRRHRGRRRSRPTSGARRPAAPSTTSSPE